MKDISSEANPAFRRWLRLSSQSRAQRVEGVTLAEGEHLVHAALAAGVPIEAALVRRQAEEDDAVAALLDAVLTAHPLVPVYRLSAALYDRLAPVEHGLGLLLAIVIADPHPRPRPDASAGPGADDLVYLDGVQDPGNAGALLRVAAAAGVTRVWARSGCAALWSPKVLRGGQGAHFILQLREGVEPETLRAEFDGHLLATALEGAVPLWQTALPPGPIGWLFGSEGHGLSPAALAVADARVMVPLATGVESLNVATAAAVCLFERRRRLWMPDTAPESGRPMTAAAAQ